MADKEAIRDSSGKIIAWFDHQPNGDIIVREFSGKVLGRYDRQYDVTREFSGRVVARGCTPGILIR